MRMNISSGGKQSDKAHKGCVLDLRAKRTAV